MDFLNDNDFLDEENLEEEFNSFEDKRDFSALIVDSQKRKFIQSVIDSEELNQRFYNIRPINLKRTNSGNQKQYGCSSIVFKANDATDEHNLAIKVLDITGQFVVNATPSFQWESKLLEIVKTNIRCQTVRYPCEYFNLKLETGNIAIPYFATIYLPIDLKGNFFQKDAGKEKITAQRLAKRLTVFIQMINSVLALHKYGIAHRDLKPENFRGRILEHKTYAVAIDLGLAIASPELEKKIREISPDQMGNEAYSAPEKLCGFYNDFELAPISDIYALGCMLYETVTKDLFYYSFIKLNQNHLGKVFQDSKVEIIGTYSERIKIYDKNMDLNFHKLVMPQITYFMDGKKGYNYIKRELQEIINFMCAFDYRKRAKDNDMIQVKERIRRIIKNLESVKYKRR